MRFAVMQPYFFPYIGYFQLASAVDTFVIFDDVQYIRRGWINRNNILLNGKAHKITLPVQSHNQQTTINEVTIAANKMHSKMLKTLESAYSKHLGWLRIKTLLEPFAQAQPEDPLLPLLTNSLKSIFEILNIRCQVIFASSIDCGDLKNTQRIIALGKALNADQYVNAIGGMDLYINKSFSDAGIKLTFCQPVIQPYTQIGSEHFISHLSILDQFANASSETIRINKGKIIQA